MTVEHIRQMTVVIPARDEATTLARCLGAIDDALSALPSGLTRACVVVLDSCRDDSVRVVSDTVRHLRTAPIVLQTNAACAGAARDLGTRLALDQAGHDLRHIWLANTDADTVVPGDWLTVQLDLADRGADAVAGIVDLDAGVDERLRRAFGASYALGHDGTHRHVHGANLGVRADLLQEVGGWRHRRTGEDHDLWRRLLTAGRCVSTTASVVRTSGRLAGRAPDGFAADLAAIIEPDRTVASHGCGRVHAGSRVP